ncbi:unnamed protein product [Rotaria sp. Silwood2]|nr:unnamed protein product [Rotaria sp. Silwood2]CAF4428015.1 unnamed protein product [Rotaria sp. Silwood2]
MRTPQCSRGRALSAMLSRTTGLSYRNLGISIREKSPSQQQRIQQMNQKQLNNFVFSKQSCSLHTSSSDVDSYTNTCEREPENFVCQEQLSSLRTNSSDVDSYTNTCEKEEV